MPALEALVHGGYEVVAVITTPNTPVGRKQTLTPSPVKLAAQKLGLKVLQPENLKEVSQVASYKLEASVGVVVSYGKIIPQTVIDLFPLGLLNIHASLLPKYRGPSPIQHALLSGDSETGVTIIKIDEKIDHGPILKKVTFRHPVSESYEKVEDSLAKLGADLLIKTLPDYLAGKIKPQPQDDSQATFTKIITKEDGKIDWHKEAKEIYNQFRAFHKWPGIWTEWRNKTLKIIDCRVRQGAPVSDRGALSTGMLFQENNQIFVPCAKGHLEIFGLQLEGGKVLTSKEFINGYGRFLRSA